MNSNTTRLTYRANGEKGANMENKGKFKPGTRFVGNVSKIEMEVVEIRGDFVLIRDIKTGMKHVHGLKMLEHCDVTILEENKNQK